MRKTIHVEIEPEQWAKIKERAQTSGRTISGVVAEALERYAQPSPYITLTPEHTWNYTWGNPSTGGFTVNIPAQTTSTTTTYPYGARPCHVSKCDCPSFAHKLNDLIACNRCGHAFGEHYDRVG
jgi:hypothetical protein